MSFRKWLGRKISGDDAKSIVSETSDEDPRKTQPCNVSGHDFEDADSETMGTYARNVGSIFSRRTTFKIYRRIYYYCNKCGHIEDDTETVGRVTVTEDDEIEVVE